MALLRRHFTLLLICCLPTLCGAGSSQLHAAQATGGPNGSGTYYMAADGKKGRELKTALCHVIYDRTEGGSLKTAYKALWTHFRSTDKKGVNANGQDLVWDMYSNKRDFIFGTDQAGNYKQEGDVYNREHSWPNSWFGGEVMPMYTDLNHMYPTDGFVNSKRSNYPFGENRGEKYTSANGFSKLGACTWPGYSGTVFEPNDEYKGDFARTYFYMVTCYEEKLAEWYDNYADVRPTIDRSTYPALTSWQLSMLMHWAQQDPVSEKEVNRNNAVYDIQENRNPFIDYPGLEQYIWGDKQNVVFHYDSYNAAPDTNPDVNNDGRVTIADVAALIALLKSSSGANGQTGNANGQSDKGDIDANGQVDVADVILLVSIILGRE